MIIASNENNIDIFGRNPDGSSYRKYDTMKPYFYKKSVFGKYKTIDGDSADKIECENFFDMFNKKQEFLNNYEADVHFTNRYIIDKFDKIPKEPLRKCYLDIETDMIGGFPDIKNPENKITVIGVYDSFDKEYKQFETKGKSEEEMLNEFIDYINKTDPDILCAWFGQGFDFPYIFNRILKLNLDVTKLGRGGKCYIKRTGNVSIYGRVCFDMLKAYEHSFGENKTESLKLDYISKLVLGDKGGKEEYEGTLDDLYNTDYQKYLSYNKKDVELLVEIDKKLMMLDFYDEVRILGHCTIEDVFHNSKVADCMCLKYAKDNNFILPTGIRHEKEKYEGGFVYSPKPQLYENVAVMDFAALYPSIMIGFNISYETIVKSHEEALSSGPDTHISVDDKYFFRKKMGIIPAILKPILKARKEVKKQMRTDSNPSLNSQQLALKIIANSFYGVMGFRSFRLYNKDVAAAITYIARMSIMEAIRWLEEHNIEVIYGDTDSVFIKIDEVDIDKIKDINNRMNNHFEKYFKNFGVKDENYIMNLELEKVFKIIFFKFKSNSNEGAKKKYAGRICWNDKKGFTDYLEIKGFESRRSDYPMVGREFIKELLNMIFDKKEFEEVKKFVDDFKDKIRNEFTPEQIGLPIGINRPLNQYRNEIHARASRLANVKYNENIQSGDKIKYIYIKGENNVIAFKEKMHKGYEIDYDNMIRRIVDLKVEPIFRSLGWEYQNKKVKKEVLTGIYKQKVLWQI